MDGCHSNMKEEKPVEIVSTTFSSFFVKEVFCFQYFPYIVAGPGQLASSLYPQDRAINNIYIY